MLLEWSQVVVTLAAKCYLHLTDEATESQTGQAPCQGFLKVEMDSVSRDWSLPRTVFYMLFCCAQATMDSPLDEVLQRRL